MTDPRVFARRIFDAGVAAADPGRAVDGGLDQIDLAPGLIIAVGKAAGLMAQAALMRFPGVGAVVVTNYENAQPIDGAQVLAAGHPVPDENGAAAGRAVLSALAAASGPVLALISGGGSALLPAPPPPVTLADKAALNTALLGAGMDIKVMNLIRQQVSLIKGGGLLRATAQPVTALILSDVVGDDLSAIASGPTVAPLGTAQDAIAALRQYGLWDELPAAITTHLSRTTVPQNLPTARNILVGSNGQSVAAMAAAAGDCHVIPTPVEGDVRDAAQVICDAAQVGVTVWGGETTVALAGSGKGGRNQELALHISCEMQRRGVTEWTCLQAGSDGRDGPVDAAGGLVDQGTLARIAAAGGDLAALLANNDSNAALGLAGDLLITGATGTNVADLGVMIRR